MMNKNNQYFLWKIEKLLKEIKIDQYNGNLSTLSPICRNGFYIESEIGNNSFAYCENRKLYVAPIIEQETTLLIEEGKEVVLEDYWDKKLLKQYGLKNLIIGKTKNSQRPFFLCDNHNIVLEAWELVKEYTPKLTLIHIDQHKDNAPYSEDPSNYKQNTKICNYINFAKQANWINSKHYSFTESYEFEEETNIKVDEKFILNIDLDIFAKEVTHIPLESIIKKIAIFANYSELITIATSPGFINQKRAIEIAKLLIRYL